jgi:hypothetical protein
MAKFMLILHHAPDAYSVLSPSEAQQTFAKYQAWSTKIRESGKFVSSEKLKEEGGKIVSGPKGRPLVVDGPFSETKEIVGGYMTIRAESYEEVVELVRDCPHLAFGRIEIRQTDAMGCGGE